MEGHDHDSDVSTLHHLKQSIAESEKILHNLLDELGWNKDDVVGLNVRLIIGLTYYSIDLIHLLFHLIYSALTWLFVLTTKDTQCLETL